MKYNTNQDISTTRYFEGKEGNIEGEEMEEVEPTSHICFTCKYEIENGKLMVFVILGFRVTA